MGGLNLYPCERALPVRSHPSAIYGHGRQPGVSARCHRDRRSLARRARYVPDRVVSQESSWSFAGRLPGLPTCVAARSVRDR